MNERSLGLLNLAVGAAILTGVLVASVSNSGSPAQRCAQRPHYVYIVDEQACIPFGALVPAR